MGTKTIKQLTLATSAANGDWVEIEIDSSSVSRRITKANFIGATLTGAGTIATGGFTLTVPATGTAALLATANAFTAAQSVSNSGASTLERTTTLTNSIVSSVIVKATTSNPMVDGFGGGIVFQARDDSGVDNAQAIIGGRREGADNSAGMGFYVYAAGVANEAVRINSAGKVGILDSTPSYELDVTGDINATGEVRNSGTPLTSDATLKQNMWPAVGSLQKLMRLRGYEFEWADKARRIHPHLRAGVQHGLSAQEVQVEFPDLVSTWSVRTGETTNEEGEIVPVKEDILCVDYARMVPLLLEAVRELDGRITARDPQ